eukprot:TRINITY_DN13581_c0_g1_i1.p2 TRINITY_DN13581_c0_g1~~TRINITY_DN13581_c0_g1_i1.p2  ORF type:complete len:200 (+),score=50.44 TRINITY_DN13581_c0_g1_i1:1312-1911(+)
MSDLYAQQAFDSKLAELHAALQAKKISSCEFATLLSEAAAQHAAAVAEEPPLRRSSHFEFDCNTILTSAEWRETVEMRIAELAASITRQQREMKDLHRTFSDPNFKPCPLKKGGRRRNKKKRSAKEKSDKRKRSRSRSRSRSHDRKNPKKAPPARQKGPRFPKANKPKPKKPTKIKNPDWDFSFNLKRAAEEGTQPQTQ